MSTHAVEAKLIKPDYASKPVTMLKDAVVTAISLVNRGANNKRFFLFKSEDSLVDTVGFYVDESGEFSESDPSVDKVIPLIKAGPSNDEWKAVYCVVAVPGEVDTQKDVWTREQIRDSAHDYLKKSRLINYMHKDFDSVGNLVESAIAPADMRVGDEIIPEGSWFIAIEPHPHVKDMIKTGEITGVSVQGSAKRSPVESGSMLLPELSKDYNTAVVPREVEQVPETIKPKNKDDMEVPANAEGPGILAVQHALGIPETGKYDEQTHDALVEWMAKKGVPGKPTIATIKLIIKNGADVAPPQEEMTQVQPQEMVQGPQAPQLSPEFIKMVKSRGNIYHFKGDSTRTPLWVTDLGEGENQVKVEFPPKNSEEITKADVYLNELERCDNPEKHYPELSKAYGYNDVSSYGGDYNPAESNVGNDELLQAETISVGSRTYGLGSQPQELDRDSGEDALRTAIRRSLSTGNEILAKHLATAYGITSIDQFMNTDLNQDQLWGIVEHFILGREGNGTSESAYLQPVKRQDSTLFPSGSGVSMQKSAVSVGDLVTYGDSQVAVVTEVKGDKVIVSRTRRSGDEVTDELSIDQVEVVGKMKKSSLGGSMGGHSPKAHGKIRFIVRSFGKWAGGKQSIAAKRLLAEHPEVVGGSPKRANALAAWLKDQWMGTTHWRHGGKKLHKEEFAPNMEHEVDLGENSPMEAISPKDLHNLCIVIMRDLSIDPEDAMPKLEDPDQAESYVDDLFGAMPGSAMSEEPEMVKSEKDFSSALRGLKLALVDASKENDLEKRENVFNHIMDDFSEWVQDFAVSGQSINLEKNEENMEDILEKGWMPEGMTQGDLEDGDFAWLSDAYKAGDEPPSSGRKLPFKIKGEVNESGWRAAWAALHGARGGVDLTGGPSMEEVKAKLLADKPETVEVAEDVEKGWMCKSCGAMHKSECMCKEMEKGWMCKNCGAMHKSECMCKEREKEANLKGATVADADGNRWIVIGHSGDVLTVMAGKKRAKVNVGDVEVVRHGFSSGGMEKAMHGKKRHMHGMDSEEAAPEEEMPAEEMAEAPTEVPEEEMAEAPEKVEEQPMSDRRGKLARLLGMKKSTEEAEEAEEVEKDALTADRIDRIRETKDFLERILSHESGSDEVGDGVEVEDEDLVSEHQDNDSEVEKDIDASETMEDSMSESDIPMDAVIDAINGLGEEVDGIMERLDQFNTLGEKLDRVGELAKSLDSADRIDALETALTSLTERIDALTSSVDEEVTKRLTALEEQPGAATASAVEETVEVVAKSAVPEQPALFTRNNGSIF